MIKIFTHDDVIRYAYNDAITKEKKEDLESAMLLDDDLMEFSRIASRIGWMLDRLKKEPSDSAIENILKYSRTYPPGTARS